MKKADRERSPSADVLNLEPRKLAANPQSEVAIKMYRSKAMI